MSRVYSRQSFDRFGDDFCELILSYLRLFDKIRYECLSKQFRRCVYSKQLRLIVENNVFKRLLRNKRNGKQVIDVKRFETFVQKLWNVRRIDVEYSQLWCDFDKFVRLLQLSVNHCQYLNEINFYFVNITDDQVMLKIEKTKSRPPVPSTGVMKVRPLGLSSDRRNAKTGFHHHNSIILI